MHPQPPASAACTTPSPSWTEATTEPWSAPAEPLPNHCWEMVAHFQGSMYEEIFAFQCTMCFIMGGLIAAIFRQFPQVAAFFLHFLPFPQLFHTLQNGQICVIFRSPFQQKCPNSQNRNLRCQSPPGFKIVHNVFHIAQFVFTFVCNIVKSSVNQGPVGSLRSPPPPPVDTDSVSPRLSQCASSTRKQVGAHSLYLKPTNPIRFGGQRVSPNPQHPTPPLPHPSGGGVYPTPSHAADRQDADPPPNGI